jgi:Transmembrane amino acid transporter protein
MMIYMVLGLCGYYSFGLKTPSLIIFRDPLPSNPHDIIMTVGLIGMGFSLLISLPLNAMPASESTLSLIFKNDRNKLVEIIVKLFYAFVPPLIAVFFQDIITAFSIIGGFCGAWVSIMIPGLGYYKSLLPQKKTKKAIVLGVTLFLTLCGWMSAVLNLLNFF